MVRERQQTTVGGAICAPWTVDLGPSRARCSACGGVEGNRLVLVPGEPSIDGPVTRYEYSHCGSCESLDLQSENEEFGDLYGAEYYSFAAEAPTGVRGVGARRRDRAEIFHERGIGALLSWAKPNPRFALLRPLADGRFGNPLTLTSRILDIGCGNGMWLRRLQAIGFTDLTGADPYLTEPVEERGLRIVSAEIDEIEGVFDLVICSHALEHMADPEEALIGMRRLLDEDGVAMVRIPLGGSYGWHRFGGEWVQLDAPRHRHLYSARGFTALASRAGLHIVETLFDATEFMVLGSEMRIAGVGPHQRRGTQGRIDGIFGSQDRRAVRRLAELTNQLGTGDQATFYLKVRQAPKHQSQG